MQKVVFSCADADPLLSRGALLPWHATGPVAVRLDPCGLLAASLSAPLLLPSCPVLLLVAAAVAPQSLEVLLSSESPLPHGCCQRGREMWCVQHLLAHSDPGQWAHRRPGFSPS